ncbi:unnamed protein product, partial [marine sediment metagenome]
NSGTSALHLIIRTLGIKEDDEVITTPFSFIASANCILFEKAKPIFVDIEKKTFNIDSHKIEEKITKKTKAILAVDVFGHPADWLALKRIAKKYKLYLIEDSAEALGSEYKGRKCGSFGKTAIFAFYPNKQITTSGEGGVVLTNNKRIAEFCRSMSNQGRREKNSKWLEHIRLGYNYRMPEVCAAMGIAQLKRIKTILAKRNKVANIYNKRLKNFPELKIPFVRMGMKVNWLVYVVLLNEKYRQKERDKILQILRKKGIGCSNYFSCIHLQPFYKKMFGYKKGDFPIAESISQRTIALPFFNNLKEKEINYVVKNLKEIITKLR